MTPLLLPGGKDIYGFMFLGIIVVGDRFHMEGWGKVMVARSVQVYSSCLQGGIHYRLQRMCVARGVHVFTGCLWWQDGHMAGEGMTPPRQSMRPLGAHVVHGRQTPLWAHWTPWYRHPYWHTPPSLVVDTPHLGKRYPWLHLRFLSCIFGTQFKV